MKSAAIWGRNRIYFYLSFFSAGSQGIITQLFVRRRYSEGKELLLPLILAAGALSYMAGIGVSGKRLGGPIRTAKAMLLLNLAGFVVMLTAPDPYRYVAAYCLACFCCNYAYNYLDHRFVSGHRGEELTVHVQAMLVFQMLAYVLSPLFFAIGAAVRLPTAAAVPFIAVACGLQLFIAPEGEGTAVPESADGAGEDRAPLSARERIFLAYVLLFLAVVAVAVSMMVYLLSEYYRFPDYEVKSGIVLTLMSLSTVPAILLVSSPAAAGAAPPTGASAALKGAFIAGREEGTEERRHFRPTLQGAVAIVSLSMVVLLKARLSRGFPYVIAVCSVLGFAYGAFLHTTRKFAGAMSRRRGRRRLLTYYNNLQSLASLIGYFLTILVWALSARNFYPLILRGIIWIFVLELILIAAWTIAEKRGTGPIVSAHIGDSDQGGR